jgi:DNA polymerase III sliding clamp (beta) subunit (PCNA family)
VGGGAKFRLALNDAADFPEMAEEEVTSSLFMHPHDLKRLLGLYVFASTDQTRPILTAVLLESHEKGVAGWATNSNHAGRYIFSKAGGTLDHGDISGLKASVMVMGKVAADISKYLSDTPVRIDFLATRIGFTFDSAGISTGVPNPEGEESGTAVSVKLLSRTVQGQYPAVRRIFRTESEVTLTIPTDDLSGALSRARIYARDDAGRVRFENADDATLKLSARSGTHGEFSEVVVCERSGGGAPVDILASVNLSIFAQFVSPGMRLGFEASSESPKAITVTPSTVEDGVSFMGITMPMAEIKA